LRTAKRICVWICPHDGPAAGQFASGVRSTRADARWEKRVSIGRGVSPWCRIHRHLPIRVQWVQLSLKLRGHYAYYGIPGNARGLDRFRHFAERAWRKWLSRRSHRARIPWDCFALIQVRYPLPAIRLLRPPALGSEAML
jgi:hypothetical protein